MSFIMGEPDDEYMDMSTEVLQCILQNPCALNKLGASLPDSTSAHGRGAEKVGPTGSQRKLRRLLARRCPCGVKEEKCIPHMPSHSASPSMGLQPHAS